jgi:hypothetical protein
MDSLPGPQKRESFYPSSRQHIVCNLGHHILRLWDRSMVFPWVPEGQWLRMVSWKLLVSCLVP